MSFSSILLRAVGHAAAMISACILLTGSLQAQIDVVILGAPNTASWNNDVESKLEGTGQFSTVDVFNISSTVPTLAYLQNYDAALVYTDGAFNGGAHADAVGDVLAQYIDDGGGVVSMVFATASIPVAGDYNTSEYLVIVPQSQTGGSNITLGTVFDASHDIMNGVTTFDGGTSSYMSTSTTITTGSSVVAEWSNGYPLVAVKEGVGAADVRRADLNFFPPSNAMRGDFWVATTDGALLMANALTWVACQAPEIVTGPASQTKCTGESVTFTVDATGDGLTYQWRKDGVDLVNGVRISGATSSSVTITGLTTADNGSYDVVVSGDCDPSATSDAATLLVHAPPTISVTVDPSSLWPPDHTMQTITADVDVTGNCTPLTVELMSVSSDEPDDANGNGDGATVNDIQGVGTGLDAVNDFSFDVRAERAGAGNGRTYTATYRVTDAAGNYAEASATIFVAHDQGNLKPAIVTGTQGRLALEQNAPNPFSSTTEIRYWTGEPTTISLKVYSIDGREIATLVDGAIAAGDHAATWDGRDASGTAAAPGIYLYRLEAFGQVQQQRMVLSR